ncbi:tetratricopeptide repeat protein [Niveibacterium umoris]|nr:hypothetical protein [Niveibacterium umoris]
MALVVVLLWAGILPTRLATKSSDGSLQPVWFRWTPPMLALGLLASFALSMKPATEPSLATPQLPPPSRPAIWGAPAPAVAPNPTQGAQAGGDLNVMVERLAQKLAASPDNGQGWLLMARTRLELHQYPEAVEAFGKAAALLPPDPSLLADWADAQVIANSGKWDSHSRDIVQRALKLDSAHLKSLMLAGSEAFARSAEKEAVSYWKRAREAAQPGSMEAKLAETNIAEAQTRLKSR